MSNDRAPSPPHHRQGRNDDNQRQSGAGRGNQRMPLANNPPPLTLAQRILEIQRGNDIVSVLSNMSYNYRQTIYILNGVGNVTLVKVTTVPLMNQLSYSIRFRKIRNLSGWFQPMIIGNGEYGVFSRPNKILHVSISGGTQGTSVATRLIASGTVEVYVSFLCGPGSIVQPGAEPIRVNIPSPPLPPPQLKVLLREMWLQIHSKFARRRDLVTVHDIQH